MSDDLVARLRHAWDERERQLDEDERVARAASPSPWVRHPNGSIRHSGVSASKLNEAFGMYVVCSVGAHDIGRPGDADADHIARHDPARVLAEVDRGRRDIAAKRRILDKLTETLATASEYFTVESCDELDAILAEGVLRLLAEAEGLA